MQEFGFKSSVKIIDTHTHIYLKEFDADRNEVIRRAKASGIEALLLPNVDVTTLAPLFNLCDTEPGFVFPMMGLHPTSVDASYVSQLSQVEKALSLRRYCGIGEIGIDLYWDRHHLPEQKIVFEEQLQWSRVLQLPVSIHVRNAFAEVFDSIYKVGTNCLRGVFHCFGGTMEELEEIRQLPRFKLGVNGIVTFKKSPLPEVLRQAGLEMLLLETDAPYLAPSPYRGKRNEPSFLWETAGKIASIFETDLDNALETIKKSTLKIFDIQHISF
ncbi:MAG: TatD family hydrolase [Tannerella sp.]|jgi:TatD DNase family protein|nr:TatD family hydrolase [Tannerella sp.]